MLNALTELQQIKEANPSEAFKCLNKIVESFNETSTGMYGLGEVVVANDLIYGFKEELETIKNYILKAQDLEKKLDDGLEKYYEAGLMLDNVKTLKKENAELKEVLRLVSQHLSFEGSGVEVVKDFINDKEETKYIIKIESKDTGATIHIHLDTEEESKLLKRYFDNENNK